MKAILAAATALLVFPVSLPASAQEQLRAQPQPVPIVTAIPAPADIPWPGGTIGLDVDATDLDRRVFRVVETIPLAPGTDRLTLMLPEWLPGKHAARGAINLLADIHFFADGQEIAWTRDPVEVYAFHLDLPTGASEVTARFVYTSPVDGSEGRIVMTREMMNIQFEAMSLYPAGHFVRQIPIRPTVSFPAEWQVFTALDGQSAPSGRITWDVTDYETLVDSPIFAGKYAVSHDLGHSVELNTVADAPGQLDIAPENLATYERLVDEALTLFGAEHYDHYEFLLALTDRMGGIGLEHHRSSENQYDPDAWTDWEKLDWDHQVISHEFVHSWNGKYRRPAKLWTPDYRQPMQDNLLWVYEGQTQFWGIVLAARSGLQAKETVLGQIASIAANYSEGQPGRAWRSVEDTTMDPIIGARRPLPYSSISRSEDYYNEGALVWLEADQLIRAETGGRKGLGDFAKAFFGINPGQQGVLTYEFEDVVAALNAVHPHDWAGFLTTRLYRTNQPAPLAGIEAAGYRLEWQDEPNVYDKGRMTGGKYLNLWYSLGLNVSASGAIASTRWDGPAFVAGIVDGAAITAVNGEAYSETVLKDAIGAAAETGEPIELLVRRGDTYTTVPVAWTGGLRYPHLVPASEGEQPLDRLLAPQAGK